MAHRKNKRTQSFLHKKWLLPSLLGGLTVLVLLVLYALGIFQRDLPAPATSPITETPAPSIAPTVPAAASPSPSASPSAAPAIAPTVSSHPEEVEAKIGKPIETPNIRYEAALTLHTDIRRLMGAMRITYENVINEPLYELVFHLHPNAFRELESVGAQAESRNYAVGGFNKGETLISTVSVNGELSYHTMSEDGLLLHVPFTKELLPGETVEIFMEYYVQVPRLLSRFGETELGYQLGNFLPVVAVYQDGAFQTDTYTPLGDPFYSEVADYTLTLKYPDKYTLACSGVILQSTAAEGFMTSVVRAEKHRDFAAMLMLQMQKAEESFNGTVVKSYALTQESAEKGLSIAMNTLKMMTGFVGPYPYETLTVAQAEFESAAGMEYPGLVMIRRRFYLPGSDRDLRMTISHEVIHQWFYGLVGNDQINAPWIDEALTFYIGMLYFEAYEPNAYEDVKRIYFTEQVTSSGHIDGAVTEYADTEEYGRSVYYRGAYMFHLLRERIGDEAFFEALKLYVERNAYGIAVKEDLITAFEQASGEELTPFFENHLTAS